ncbi:MAG: hypothetical protein H6R22_1052 [Chromatiaceae bacterium]|nr:hypothetical protein [Chromatiaceae bacterium]
MSQRFYLYRFEHADGTAKEWAYADLGTGWAEIRWGKAGRLCQSQMRPIAVAIDRAAGKCRKGYRYIGDREMDARGAAGVPGWNRACGPDPSPKTSPIDIAALLGGDDEGFYF